MNCFAKQRIGTLLLASLAVAFLASCQGKKTSDSTQTDLHTTPLIGAPEAKLKAALGPPVSTTNSKLKPGAQLYEYKNGHKYQIEHGKVEAHFRKPKTEDEKKVRYWKKVLEKGPYKILTLNSEGTSEKQLVSTKQGITVIFDDRNGRVRGITEYAQKNQKK